VTEVRNAFATPRVVCDCGGPSKAKQSFRDECDVNVIMSRWEKSGVPPSGTSKTPMYGDFSTALEFQEALDRVMAAQRTFEGLPAAVRRRCGNDPALFVEFCEDPANLAELVKLGLAREAPKPPAGALDEAEGISPQADEEQLEAT